MDRTEWKHYGYAGHLIVSAWCRFHLCTELPNGYMVSTVGDYHSPADMMKHGERTKPTTIGAGNDSFYETYVFRVNGEHCSADGCDCGLPVMSDACEIDGARAATAGEASANHWAFCEKWADVKRGEDSAS